MILTNLSMVPGKRIAKTLGIAYGFSSVKDKDGRRWLMDTNRKEWPWADSPEHFEALFKDAEKRLELSGSKIGGDAIIKVEGKLSRDQNGNPEMLLMGTAVKLLKDKNDNKTGTVPEKIEVKEEEGDSISFQVDGEEMTWKTPPATTPTKDVLRKMRERGPKEVEVYQDDSKLIILIAQEIGIPHDRAKLLIDGGFDSLEKIINASSSEISTIEGINPTQARIIRKKAKEMEAEK